MHWKLFTESGFFDNDKKICDYSEKKLQKFLYGEPEKIKIDDVGTMNLTYEGLLVKFNRLYLKKEGEVSEASKKKLSKLLIEGECPLCNGKRLHERVYKVLINEYNIADLTSMQIDELIKGIVEKLNNIIDIGLGYLTLERNFIVIRGRVSRQKW